MAGSAFRRIGEQSIVETGPLRQVRCGLVGVLNRNGHEGIYLDIRQWFHDDEGQWHPTKKGVLVHEENLEALANAVERCRVELEKEDEDGQM